MQLWNTTSSLSTDVMHSWTRYGRVSNPRWHWCFFWQRSTGHLLYLSHSPYLDATCSSTSHSWPTGIKYKIIGIAKLILTWHPIIAGKLIMITKLAIRFCWQKKVFSAKQKTHIAKSHGLSWQFIRMELSGFNAEQNQNNLISGE